MTESTSEGFGNIPNASANFGTFPQSAEDFRTVRNGAERTEQHTLTVREVARLFEQAGVPRTERSIINWCQPNRQGVARLDAFFDPNERKYFITQESVTRAVEEERSRQVANAGTTNLKIEEELLHDEVPKRSEAEERDAEAQSLKMRDLEITNRAKDYFIEELRRERETFNIERERYVAELVSFSRKVGELETELLRLDRPRKDEVEEGRAE